MEKIKLIETLNDEEKKTIYKLDTFVGKKKLKDAFSDVLPDVK